MKFLTRLDRYIIGKFLGTYFFSIALILSIAVVFDLNENIDNFVEHNAPVMAVITDYYSILYPTLPPCSVHCSSS